MTIQDSTTPLVLVTGASGYIASWVAYAALKVGYRVRGTVRSIADETKVGHLHDLCPGALHRMELVEADLMSDADWDNAVKDCTYILHLACPNPLEEPDDLEEVVRPAVDGTLRILRAASRLQTPPKRVIVTSSLAAFAHGHSKSEFNEDDWSILDGPIPPNAHVKAKTSAERAAWDFVTALPDHQRFELSSVAPAFVFGPMLSKSPCTSANIIRQMAMGVMPALPDIHLNYVSVLDVARAHILAMTHPHAAGKRFLVASGKLSLRKMGAMVAKELKPLGYNCTTVSAPGFVIHALALAGDKLAKASLPLLGKKDTANPQNARSILGLELREDPTLILEMLHAAIHAQVIPDKTKDNRLVKNYVLPKFDCSVLPPAVVV